MITEAEEKGADQDREKDAGEAGTEKPEAPDWLIDSIAEVSKNTRSLYLWFLGFLAYCALALATTTDRQIVLDEGVLLPIIGLSVPLGVFFVVAPLLAILLFTYLQLYLQRLKGLVEDLRQNFRPIPKRRLYPWILNIAEDPESGSIGVLQRLVPSFVLWWALPMVLLLFVWISLKKHDVALSMTVGVLSGLGFIAAGYFWYQYARPQWKVLSKEHVNTRVPFGVLVFSLLALKLSLVGVLASLALQGKAFTVDLSYQVLITEQKYAPYWLDLNGAHLEGANLQSAVLRRADLRRAFLQGAVLREARLDSADLSFAHLPGAVLTGARLDSADLTDAQLQGAILIGAQLQGAVLDSAQLQGANLRSAQLQRANLFGARLDNADLRDAQLQGAELSLAQLRGANLYGARLDSAYLRLAQLQGAELSLAQLRGANLYGARLDSADLRDAQLQGAKLCFAQLPGAVLTGARLDSADLTGAQLPGAVLFSARLDSADLSDVQLQNVVGLEIDQLCRAKTLYAIIPHSLRARVEEECPEKLNRPGQ